MTAIEGTLTPDWSRNNQLTGTSKIFILGIAVSDIGCSEPT